MTLLRVFVLGVLFLFIGIPLTLPFLQLSSPAVWQWTAGDFFRLTSLLTNTILLVVGTLSISLPLGVGLALMLQRTPFVGRRIAWNLLAIMMLLPLAVHTAFWQGLIGRDGILPWPAWGEWDDRLWSTGWIPAIWIHSAAAIPWVAWFMSLGLCSVPREVEDLTLLEEGPVRTLFHVTLPHCQSALLGAIFVLAPAIANEITVTDMVQIATFAEEMQLQFTTGNQEALARTILLYVPFVVLFAAGVAWQFHRLESVIPTLSAWKRDDRPWPISTVHLTVVAWAFISVGMLLPIVGALGKLGSLRDAWSLPTALSHLENEARLVDFTLASSIVLAGVVAASLAGAGLFLAWLAETSRVFRMVLIGLLSFAWVVPPPLVGIALKDAITWIVENVPFSFVHDLLYYAPSPVPIVWVHFIRFLPVAVFLSWPLVRGIPRELIESSQLEGAVGLRQFSRLVWPATKSSFPVIGFALGALSLGEVGATIRVETPGWQSFAKLIFDRLHYGVDNNVAALSLLMVMVVAALTWLGSLWWERLERRT